MRIKRNGAFFNMSWPSRTMNLGRALHDNVKMFDSLNDFTDISRNQLKKMLATAIKFGAKLRLLRELAIS